MDKLRLSFDDSYHHSWYEYNYITSNTYMDIIKKPDQWILFLKFLVCYSSFSCTFRYGPFINWVQKYWFQFQVHLTQCHCVTLFPLKSKNGENPGTVYKHIPFVKRLFLPPWPARFVSVGFWRPWRDKFPGIWPCWDGFQTVWKYWFHSEVRPALKGDSPRL